MNLHQFRFVQEAVRRNLNLTEAARALHTSQPGVSKAIIELEEELGIEIFARHGKRLKRVTMKFIDEANIETHAGKAVLRAALATHTGRSGWSPADFWVGGLPPGAPPGLALRP